ncbi:unnamed protein product [Amoebophrya sp. A25]|nr:unnamed protein product [Amoebophrya sp. A25]|eukprot:GSA25T00021844001.1
MDLDDIGIPSLVPASQLGQQAATNPLTGATVSCVPTSTAASVNPLTGGGGRGMMPGMNPLTGGPASSSLGGFAASSSMLSTPGQLSTSTLSHSNMTGALPSIPPAPGSYAPQHQQYNMMNSGASNNSFGGTPAGPGGFPPGSGGYPTSSSLHSTPGMVAMPSGSSTALAVAERAGALTGSLVGATQKLMQSTARSGAVAAAASSVVDSMLGIPASASSSAGQQLHQHSNMSLAGAMMNNNMNPGFGGAPGGGLGAPAAGNTSLYQAIPNGQPPAVTVDESQPLWVRITKTETKLSFLLQEYTDYVIEVHDFGRNREVHHRFNDFFVLHSHLAPLDLNLPVLPQKGLDSTDPVVVEDRKAKLSIFLQYCLTSEVIRLEKQLFIWKFLNFENAGLSVCRFVLGPEFIRGNLFKTLPKLVTDEKYQADLYRLAHKDVVGICTDHILSATPDCVAQAAQLLTGAIKVGKMDVVDLLSAKPGFLHRVLRALDIADNFGPIRGLLSAILLTSGDKFPGTITGTLMESRDVLLELLSAARPVVVHELLAKLIWFALETDMREFLFSEQGLSLLVALFSSRDRNTQLLACIVSGVGIITGACEAGRGQELMLKMEEVWAQATEGAQEQDPNLAKLTAALCMHQSSMQRVSVLLIDPRFAKYGIWLLKKANLSMKHLQQILTSLTRILEVPDHPCRYHAAELLLRDGNSSYDFGASLDGLPAFEASLEKAILDPLAVSLAGTAADVGKMKVNTSWQAEKVSSCFPQLPQGSEHMQGFEKTFTAYLAIQQELKSSVQQNDEYASDLMRIAENCQQELTTRTFSEAERANYINRLSTLEVTHGQAGAHRKEFQEKDGKLQSLTQTLTTKQKELTELEKGLQQVNSEAEQKKRLVENARAMLQQKRQALGANNQEQATQIRQRLEQVQERQKTLAMVHMKVQQGDQFDITPYLTAPGLAVAAQGSAQQVKVEHAHWKQQEQALTQHLQQVGNFDPTKLQEEIAMLDRQVADNDAALLSLESKKSSLAQRLAEVKVDFESERHLFQSARSVRDEGLKQVQRDEAGMAEDVRRAQTEIMQRHQALSNLMRAGKELSGRGNMLETKVTGISQLLESEIDHRQNLRRAIAQLGQYLTQLDSELSQLGTGAGADLNITPTNMNNATGAALTTIGGGSTQPVTTSIPVAVPFSDDHPASAAQHLATPASDNTPVAAPGVAALGGVSASEAMAAAASAKPVIPSASEAMAMAAAGVAGTSLFADDSTPAPPFSSSAPAPPTQPTFQQQHVVDLNNPPFASEGPISSSSSSSGETSTAGSFDMVPDPNAATFSDVVPDAVLVPSAMIPETAAVEPPPLMSTGVAPAPTAGVAGAPSAAPAAVDAPAPPPQQLPSASIGDAFKVDQLFNDDLFDS